MGLKVQLFCLFIDQYFNLNLHLIFKENTHIAIELIKLSVFDYYCIFDY